MRTGKRTFIAAAISGLFFLLSGNVSAQNLPIGGWRMHLPYQSCKYVTGSSTTIWSATDKGLFSLNKADYSVSRITKIEGLSDLSIGAIGYNAYNNTLLVGYANGNIDLVRGNQVTNLPDIKRAQIIGNKAVNSFYFVGKLAYVATGFGIVVIDTDRDEVKDTYFIGNNGGNLEVFDIVSDGTTIFAGTETGVYYAPINDPFLSNFTTWQTFNNLPPGALPPYMNVDIFNGKLMVGSEPGWPTPSSNDGVIYAYDFSTSTWSTVFTGFVLWDMQVRNNMLYIADTYGIYYFDTAMNQHLAQGIDGAHPIFPREVYVDADGTKWEADNAYGLVRVLDDTHGQSFYPNGPISTSAYAMDMRNQQLLVVTGGHDDAWNNVFNKEGYSNLKDNNWTTHKSNESIALDSMFDFISCAIDPDNANHYFLGSWGRSLLEMKDGAVEHVWNTSNSTLQMNAASPGWIGIGGMAYDDKNNLWLTNSHVMTALNVYKTDGSWQAFDFTGYIPIGMTVSELMITESGQKWMILPRGSGMLVFDDNGTLNNTADDKKRRLGFTAGNGGLPGTDVYCMAEDQDNEIWVGTDKGIAVFYCAENIFTSSGCDAQQILINQDGHVQILLETQSVTCIAVDGANRKWIGTESGGVFLMSADGSTQLAHFDASNSPLLSDNITSLAINKITGEVFFGTDKGIVSYRGEAIEGLETMGDVYAFPNPVKPDYHGPIAITGLVKDADVKITDVRGNVVFKTVALGGQAIWDGNNFKGERAASGVYLVFITNEDGTEKAITKILLMN